MGLAEELFTLLVMVVSAGVTAHIAHGFSTKKARELFVALVLFIIVGVQMFHLVYAVTYIPATRFYTWKEGLHRTDCITSLKGGKRSGNSTDFEDINPCFCESSLTGPKLASCYTTVKDSTKVYLSTDKCPIDGTAKCRQGTRHEDRIHRWVPSLRDCRGGQLTQCTKEQPCTPCGRDSLSLFKQGRCRTCSTQNLGNCNFVPGVGPYCLVSPSSKAIEPCKRCCTEPEPLFDADGYCW